MYMLSNLWQNILCKAQYLKLQYFCFWGKTKHIRRTSKCWPCAAPGRPEQRLCGRVVPGVGTRRVSSPQHAGVPRIVWVRRPRGWAALAEAEPQQWRRSHTAVVNVPEGGGGTRDPAPRSVSSPFRLTSQLCAGQKVVLYRRYLTVPFFWFFLQTLLLLGFFLEFLTGEQPSFLPCLNALKQPNGSWNYQTGFRHKTF